MYKILIADKLGQAGLDRLNQMDDMSYDIKTGLSKEAFIETIPDYDALIVRSGTRPDADMIAAGTKLRVIGRAGIGVDNIDINAATQNGVIVMNTPRANSVTTAEQTMALMLAAARHTAPAHLSVAAGEWKRSQYVGTELRGKTLGVIGFGYIGRLVTKRAQAFEMNVIAYDPYVSETVGRSLNVELVDLDDLLSRADIITLHTIVSDETKEMINADTINRMKNGVMIVNVARGKLINEAALAEALQNGKVAAAALDVYFKEPPENSPLIGLPNVLHTPHLGASTKEAQAAVAIEMVEQIADALRGTDFRNTINVTFPTGLDFNSVRPYMDLAEKLGRIQQAMASGPIFKVEVEVSGERMGDLVKLIASAMLKGLLAHQYENISEINAPVLAKENGIMISQEYGLRQIDYSNLISCRVHWHRDGDDEMRTRLVAGVLYGDVEPRIAQVDEYRLEAKPDGIVLVLRNRDVPGVVGQIGTILATYDINIGEWRMGRTEPGGEALSFINLDKQPPAAVIDALTASNAITLVKLIEL